MMKATSAEMDQVWPNLRRWRAPSPSPTTTTPLSVKSTQGHNWTTYGRATDYCERTWSDNLRPVPLCGVADDGRPQEGSLFDWLQNNDVVYDILGEIVGQPLTAPPTLQPRRHQVPRRPGAEHLATTIWRRPATPPAGSGSAAT